MKKKLNYDQEALINAVERKKRLVPTWKIVLVVIRLMELIWRLLTLFF